MNFTQQINVNTLRHSFNEHKLSTHSYTHLALSKVAAFDFPIAPNPTPTARPSVQGNR